ncbi:MAG: 3-deoxy-D-manno-octulosonic acid transferase [Lewinellaceae bacterium]|nr:3-deoxy-D-manno-octulosonic acid transferase [Lewinellaceae bacterium]
MALLYEIGIRFFTAAVYLASFFNTKARHWVAGRRHWRDRYAREYPADHGKKTLWIHAASLGEFEQGRPVIESFRAAHPEWFVVLTFFSPSGYEVRKNYAHADFICYLPADTRRNAVDFTDLIRPDAVIFIKYEFWANYLGRLKQRRIPTLLISALFRDTQPFFRWYGAFWRQMLGCFTHFFVQNAHSAKLLQQIGLRNTTIAGDTRVDRVLDIARNTPANEIVADFAGEPGATKVFIAGSSWRADEELFLPVLHRVMTEAPGKWKIIVAPHDPSAENVGRIFRSAGAAFPAAGQPVLCYSRATPSSARLAQILIIDNVGLLNTLYRYGTVAYIGGGFGKGIHNTLEPAAFGLPVIFGPEYKKFEEARQFVARGGAYSVTDADALSAVLDKLQDPAYYQKASGAVLGYLEDNRGATEQILSFFVQIQEENP